MVKKDTAPLVASKFAELRRRSANGRLIDFVSYVFRDLHNRYYDAQWFHRAICDEIDYMLYSGEADYNLMIFMPPRHGKSEIVSRFLPPYILGRDPSAAVIGASYGAELQESMCRDAQRIMVGRAYSEIYPLTRIANSSFGASGNIAKRTSSEFEIVGNYGRYIGCGVGGAITGRGANVGIIDDPVKNREEAESEAYRRKVADWYFSTFRTRLEKNAKMILLMTRWHEDDLAGRILNTMSSDDKADRWKIISILAEFESDADNIYPLDPRKADGEALWPNKYNVEALQKIKSSITSYEWSALYQQRPAPRGGGHIKPEWFILINESDVPDNLRWVRGWDLAVSVKKSADFTASIQAAMDDAGNLYLREGQNFKREWPQTRAVIKATALFERCPVGVEKVGQQGGLIDDLKQDAELQTVRIKEVVVDKDKLTRSLPWASLAERGKVYLVKGSWAQTFLIECAHFSGQTGCKDNLIDAVSIAYSMLQKQNRTARAGRNIFDVPIIPQSQSYNLAEWNRMTREKQQRDYREARAGSAYK